MLRTRIIGSTKTSATKFTLFSADTFEELPSSGLDVGRAWAIAGGQAYIPETTASWRLLGGEGVVQYALQLDEDAIAGVTYVGEAQPGTTTATGEWRIKRITESGVDVAIHWAGGEATFVNVWDDRLGLSYS